MKRLLTASAVAGVALTAALAASGGRGFLSASRAYAEQAGWGTVRGRIVYAGETPARTPINVGQDQQHCLANGPLLSEDLVVNKANKGIEYAFVWLLPPKRGEHLPIHPQLQNTAGQPVVLDQPRCMFVPHALGIRQGQELLVKNSAVIAHNVKWEGNPLQNPGGNQLLPAGGSFTIRDLKAQRLPIPVKCNIHPWMTAWLGVYDHPYFAVTDADGNFEIKLAPAGRFPLMIWQEKIGYRGGAKGRNGMPVEINNGGVTDLGQLEMK